MFAFKTKTALAASAFALSALSIPAAAQVVSGGTQGGVRGENVAASTCGYGSTDGSGTMVGGCAEAEARDGTANTRTDAKSNERRAMQRSVANARTDDERARSRTRTVVRNGEVVRSRTMSMYKMKGEKPVREVVSSKSTPEGTKTKKRDN